MKKVNSPSRRRVSRKSSPTQSPTAPQTSSAAATPPQETPDQKYQPHDLLTEFELAKAQAVGLLDGLSKAYSRACDAANCKHREQIGWGIVMVANDILGLVALNWEALQERWSSLQKQGLLEGATMDALPQALKAAFCNLASPLRYASACIHALILALGEHAREFGRFHTDGVVEGYDQLAHYWPSLILEPCDALEEHCDVDSLKRRGAKPRASGPLVAA